MDAFLCIFVSAEIQVGNDLNAIIEQEYEIHSNQRLASGQPFSWE
jgi:hypothetical protein